ncbi:hypothetical protein H310_05177 [Aphanomyces invadans]|uniref:PX domain-containing protein n=1 Tax=Aphanomyces invadans TaxID=157072 RepID=A0A024UD54_9STRA|nr:hypothetical protein H310_05177 [Aphanomyces invadans]ETW03812.1 hypothetical protein H310_05177 [Aphanomyces invadans]|eukprot:XP_008868041.1 hypothetical protein H310_05177 [Aphanomyces invadans]
MVLDAITGWCRPLASPPASKFDRRGREVSRASKLLQRAETGQSMDVDVVDHAVTTCGRDTFTVYIIVVTKNGVTSTVLRRYRQFFALHEQLRHVVASASSRAFPDRIVLNNRSTALVRHRQSMLNLYLKTLVADAAARASHPLRTFLGLEVLDNEASQYVGFEWTHRSGRFS